MGVKGKYKKIINYVGQYFSLYNIWYFFCPTANYQYNMIHFSYLCFIICFFFNLHSMFFADTAEFFLSFCQLDPTATTDLLGWVVASYSIGQLIASPVFGKMANWLGRSRDPLVVSLIINILANILYAYLEDIQHSRVICLIAARTLIGFGAGSSFCYT